MLNTLFEYGRCHPPDKKHIPHHGTTGATATKLFRWYIFLLCTLYYIYSDRFCTRYDAKSDSYRNSNNIKPIILNVTRILNT